MDGVGTKEVGPSKEHALHRSWSDPNCAQVGGAGVRCPPVLTPAPEMCNPMLLHSNEFVPICANPSIVLLAPVIV